MTFSLLGAKVPRYFRSQERISFAVVSVLANESSIIPFYLNGPMVANVCSFLPVRRYASVGLCDSDVSGRLSVTRRYCA